MLGEELCKICNARPGPFNSRGVFRPATIRRATQACEVHAVARTSAGLLMFRRRGAGGPEVLLAHPGGPFWRRKDAGAWSIPKGEIDPDEDQLRAAIREFTEETGAAPAGDFLPLGELRQAGGKRVVAFAVEGDFDPRAIRSNTFAVEWPPRSGRMQSFPEIDRAEWFGIEEARGRILKSQIPFLDRLQALLGEAAARRAGRPVRP